MKVVAKVTRGVGYLILVMCALIGLFSLLGTGTTVRFVAQFFTAAAGGPILAVLLLGCVIGLWRWRRTKERLALTAAVISGLGASACAYTLASYLEVARQHQVPINFGRIFLPGPFSFPGPKAEEYVFDHFDGEVAKVLVYQPAPRPDRRKAPILVYVHGGGWIVGDAGQRAHDWQWFARQGYLLVAVNYSLSSTKRHLWNVTQPQIGCALSWIERNGPKLGGDPARIAMIGESAGGNLVLSTSGRAYRGELPSRCGGSVPKIRATISISPPTDLVALYAHEPARKFAFAYTGGSPSHYPDRYATVSPIVQAGRAAPPLLLMTGQEDGLVPPHDMFRYAELAKRTGQSVEVITVPRAGHGFEVIPGSIGHQIMMKGSDAFLRRHGMQP